MKTNLGNVYGQIQKDLQSTLKTMISSLDKHQIQKVKKFQDQQIASINLAASNAGLNIKVNRKSMSVTQSTIHFINKSILKIKPPTVDKTSTERSPEIFRPTPFYYKE